MPEADFESAKKEVEKLVLKLKQVKESGRLKNYNEENTKKDFITPIFRALGWDMENLETPDEVTNEDRVSKGRVDYAFRLNGIPKFFLEAKAINKGIDEAKDAGQAINYSWHKGTTWAVLTDFQTLSIYNAEVKEKNLSDARFISLSCEQFADQFQKLWWLSRQSFQEGLLDKEAVGWGKKLKKTKVGDQLLQELMGHRELLSKNILKNNSGRGLSEEDLDEAVQRIIDRLIFIRTAEDRQIEPPVLLPKLREFQEKGRGKITAALNEVYLQFDKTYNSKLFTFDPSDLSKRHICETLEVDNDVLAQVINGLYKSRDGLINYDFSAIDADVLGNIYEQYLSHILKKTEKRAKVESKEAHRKEQGIYYTPTYIVDYIVKNTLGELLKNRKPAEADKLKVLDMTCGSGSFLLKAFDVLDEYYQKHEKGYAQAKLDVESEAAKITRKTKILKNNIHGVDLDPKAVEIAQLNLLLKAAETKHRLPDLRENIKCGNSLIDQSLSEETRAFDWKKEFPGIMKEGGFDLIIGNPPYEVLAPKERSEIETKREISYYRASYQTLKGKLNLYQLMIEKAYHLLRDGGQFGFIVPNTIMAAQNTSGLRRFLLENVKNIRIFEFPEKARVFKNVTQGVCILMFTKGKAAKQAVSICSGLTGSGDLAKARPFEIELNDIQRLDRISMPIPFVKDNGEMRLLRKILTFPKIKDIKNIEVFQGEVNLTVFKDCLRQSGGAKLVRGDQVKRYTLSGGYESKPSFLDAECFIKKAGLSEKAGHHLQSRLAFQEVANIALKRRLNGVLVDKGLFLGHTCNYIVSKNENILNVLLGLFNSSLSNWRFKLTSATNHVSGEEVRQLPVPEADPSKDKAEYKEMAVIVNKMLALNKRLNELGGKQTDERARLEKEIAETDRRIDGLVYELYGLTEDEIKIIEG